MQKIKLRTEESGKKLSAAYAPPKWSETAEEEEDRRRKLHSSILPFLANLDNINREGNTCLF